MNPTTQPIKDEKDYKDTIDIMYEDIDTVLQESYLYRNGKKYRVVERVLKDRSKGDIVVKIESKEEIINENEKRINQLENQIRQILELLEKKDG